jgi:putative ubiquitin-RnfH superfamily antitoxin RatB of RatAB toxin-antitoxin module
MSAPLIEVEIVFSPGADRVEQRSLQVSVGTPVRDALVLAGLDLEALQANGLHELGIWGRRATMDTPLRERDRIELYRPLTVDPKEARRLRYRGQRAAKPVKRGRGG